MKQILYSIAVNMIALVGLVCQAQAQGPATVKSLTSPGGPCCFAYGVNGNDQVAGFASTAEGPRAFLWRTGKA